MDKKIFFLNVISIKKYIKIILLLVSIYLVIKYYDNFNEPKKPHYYTIERYGPLDPSKVTVVSVYFKFNKSKHSVDTYKIWNKNFFLSIKSPLVIFTDKSSIQDLLDLRNLLQLPTSLYVTDNIWNVMKENELKRHRNYTFNYQNKQKSLDRESYIHNPNLYAVWNLKSFIANKIAQDNFYKSSSFIYSDAGSWRERILENWPDQSIVMNITNLLNDKILLGQLWNESKAFKDPKFPDADLIQGNFFMGSRKAMHQFYEDFWKIHDLRFDKGLFIGKDQTLMNYYAYNMSNSVKLDVWKLLEHGWWFYQYYLANNDIFYKYYPKAGDRVSLLSVRRV